MNERFSEPLTPNAPAEPAVLRRERRRLAWLAIAVLWVYFCTYSVQLSVVAVCSAWAPNVMESPYWMWLMQLPMYAVAIPTAGLLLRPCKCVGTAEKRSISFPVFLGLLAICFAMSLVGSLLGNAVNGLLSFWTGKPIENTVAEMTQNSSFWMNFLFVAVLAPLFEELFYRKLLIDRLRHYGTVPAMLLSGVLFGLIHGNFSQFFYAAMIGCLLGGVYLYTGKLRYSVGLHAAINFTGGVFTAEATKRMGLGQSSYTFADALRALSGCAMLFAYMAILAVAVCGAVVAVRYLLPRWKPQKAEHPFTGREWAQVLLLNPAVWALVGCIAVLFVLSVVG